MNILQRFMMSKEEVQIVKAFESLKKYGEKMKVSQQPISRRATIANPFSFTTTNTTADWNYIANTATTDDSQPLFSGTARDTLDSIIASYTGPQQVFEAPVSNDLPISGNSI